MTMSIEQIREVISRAVATGGFSVFAAASAQKNMADAAQRRELVGDRCVAAFIGGTGAGKSSLFNAVTGLEFADAGAVRPSTHEPSACVWGSNDDDLLDMLSVAPSRRIQHHSDLVPSDPQMEGLILLDLPDVDSIEAANATVVERLLPLIDLLIWVVDPQKYADDVLHGGYLAHMSARREASVVILNHGDTLGKDAQGAVEADLRAILEREGLGDVPVMVTSAATGAGVPELTAEIKRRYLAGGHGELTERAELMSIIRQLRADYEWSGTRPDPEVTREAVRGLIGYDVVQAKAGEGVLAPTPPAVTPGKMQKLRERWIRGCDPLAAEAVRQALPDQHKMSKAVNREVAGVSRKKKTTGDLLSVVGVLVGGGCGAASTVVSGTLGTLALVGCVLGLIMVAIGVYMQRHIVTTFVAAYAAGIGSAIDDVVDSCFIQPTKEAYAPFERVAQELDEALA